MNRSLLRYSLCMFFLQYSLFAAGHSDQSSKKIRQSHSHFSSNTKVSKKNAHRFVTTKRRGNCGVSCKQKTIRASWYGPGFHGNKTKCGGRFNQYALTAASNVLPCGARVRLHYEKTGKTVEVRINDTGSFTAKYGRDLDVSRGAAERLGMKDAGLAMLQLTVISQPLTASGV